jgi:hypothetical protein
LTQIGFGLLPQLVCQGAVYARWRDHQLDRPCTPASWPGALLMAADVIEEARS